MTRNGYGGSCYLNNAAVAAQALRDQGHDRVAIVDVDAHHGNGTEAIFYGRGDVFYGSVHIDPGAGWFPHVVGFADETGRGDGLGANLNLPLQEETGDGPWVDAVGPLAAAVEAFGASALVVSLGVDAAADDPESPLRVTARRLWRGRGHPRRAQPPDGRGAGGRRTTSSPSAAWSRRSSRRSRTRQCDLGCGPSCVGCIGSADMTSTGPGFKNQEGARTAFRILGVLLVGVGVIFMAVAAVDFFSGFNDFDAGPPTKFWMFFVGIPLLAVGGWCVQAGFMGAAARYTAGELAPPVRDTMDYVGIGKGGVACAQCGARNDHTAKFCDDCGAALGKACSSCGKANSGDARFCADCGVALA